MFSITKIARRGGGVAVAAGLAMGVAAPALAAAPSGINPSHYVLATEGPGLKAPAAKRAPKPVRAPAPVAGAARATHSTTRTARTCKAGTHVAVVKGARTCVKAAPVRR